MKMRQFFGLGIVIPALLLMSGLPCSARQPSVEKIDNAGTIDWVTRKLTATGIGVPTQKAIGQAQMRAMVRRAAIVVARRNLLEVVKGVHIDSTTRVQNFMVKSDTIESRIKGVLSGSSVVDVIINSNGTAVATVSIPLTGPLEAMLMRMVVQPPKSPVRSLPLKEIDSRIRFLEKRVRTLEEKVGRLKSVSVSQEQMLIMFRRFAEAWLDYVETVPTVMPAGLASGESVTELKNQTARQEAVLTQITARLNNMATRLKALEEGKTRPMVKTSRATVNYTGLVIDARNTGFRPCLKPEIAGPQVIYPGNYINREQAVRSGYVRYYRNLARAQRSLRAGSLPLTLKATGTGHSKRSLSIRTADYKALVKMSADRDGFLANCKVIIVF
ncbi:MAG: hypothetical protein GY697_23995 [Desulfobacterales bacterium]|nr:hypothetical protein [Desulfobacterales bacterium]